MLHSTVTRWLCSGFIKDHFSTHADGLECSAMLLAEKLDKIGHWADIDAKNIWDFALFRLELIEACVCFLVP